MIEQISNTLIVGVKFYGSTGAGITGLTDITTYVYKLTVSGSTITSTTIMNGVNQATANMIEVGRGLYAFPILAADLGAECVVFYQCETATSTVTNKTEAAAYTVGKAGVENLDATVASRLAAASYTAPPTSAAIADAVMDELTTDHTVPNSLSDLVNSSATLAGTINSTLNGVSTRIPGTLSGGRMRVDVEAISSDVTAANNAESFFDGTGYAGTNNVIPTVTTVTGLTPAAIADAVLEESIADHYTVPLSLAAYINSFNSQFVNLTARLGAWTGSGVNTVLGAFKALLSKTATVPSDIGGTFDPATDSTEAIRDRGDAAWVTGGGASVEDIIDGIEASPVIDSIYDKTLQIGAANATIVTPVAPSGTLTIHQGVSMTLWESMSYDCRLISGFDEAMHPVKLFIDYKNGSKLVATIDVADITETASAIQVDLAPTFTSAVTREMPIGSFPAQIVAFTSSSAERHIILELTIEVKKPGFDYSAVDTI